MKFHFESNQVGRTEKVGTQQHADSAEHVQQSNLANVFRKVGRLEDFQLRWPTLNDFPYPSLYMDRLERWTRSVVSTLSEFQPVSDLSDAGQSHHCAKTTASSLTSFLKRPTDYQSDHSGSAMLVDSARYEFAGIFSPRFSTENRSESTAFNLAEQHEWPIQAPSLGFSLVTNIRVRGQHVS